MHRQNLKAASRQILFIIVFLISISFIYARIFTVRQDGTGDYARINHAVSGITDGDTVLVYPGVYYENIRFFRRNITVTSLYGIESEDRNVIRETVIDGNQNGAVVNFTNEQAGRDTVLNGFTIRNGTGNDDYYYHRGGGIHILYASPVISNCIIEHNTAFSGGGIYSHGGGIPLLKGNKIRYNNATAAGGGVANNARSSTEFCSENLNSIYLNYAAKYNDLLCTNPVQQSVVLDTLTVLNPDRSYVSIGRGDRTPPDFSFTVLNGKIEPVEADLYVGPDGCDTNSGLTSDDPLQTIARATMIIKPDSQQRRNIYVAEGVYSHSLNNQFFPISLRSFINIVGEDRETTILDLERKAWAFDGSLSYSHAEDKYKSDFSVKNFTTINGGIEQYSWGPHVLNAVHILCAHDFELKNIRMLNGTSVRPVLELYGGYNTTLKNIDIADNVGGFCTVRLLGSGGFPPSFYGENIRIRRHAPCPYGVEQSNTTGIGMVVYLFEQDSYEPFNGTIVNLEITDNVMYSPHHTGHFKYSDSGSHVAVAPRKLRIINATIANNINIYCDVHPVSSGGAEIRHGANTEIINSIIYGNLPDLGGRPTIEIVNRSRDLTISHSLIRGGIWGVWNRTDCAQFEWGEGNIDADPMWVGEEVNPDYPYMLYPESPARGAGTLDIPDFEFPEYDLAGNPRIVDGQIDMGAYQWHPPERDRVRRRITADERYDDYNLRNFPNPAVNLGRKYSSVHSQPSQGEGTGTTISFEAPEAGDVVIEIYNTKGQFVRRILDANISAGEHNVYWDGRDERNRPVATGFYMYQLKFNDRLVATGRCTFIK